jgi:hypothetical protein
VDDNIPILKCNKMGLEANCGILDNNGNTGICLTNSQAQLETLILRIMMMCRSMLGAE